MIAAELAQRLGGDLGASSSEALWAELTSTSKLHRGVTAAKLARPANADGIVLDLAAAPFEAPEPTHVEPKNAYSLRLVVNRTLYDDGTSISHCESSSSLAPAAALHLGTADAAPLGIESGTRVTVSSSNGSLSVPAVVDGGVPKGSALLHHNLAGADAGVLVSADDVVCDIRVEVG